MKKLILIMLAVLTASALAYRLPTAWSVGGGMSYDSVRVTIWRPATAGAAMTNVKDTSITGAGTSGNRVFYVDSLVTHNVRYLYFSSPDTFREYSYDIMPIEMAQFTRAYLSDLDTGMTTVLDTLSTQNWGNANVTLTQADIDSIVAGVIAGTIAANGTGIFAVTMYARDTVNGAFVPNINLTAVSGATNLFATTSSTGAATFNVDAATWTFNALGSPYTWVPFSRTVAANITDTINGGGVVVVAPSSPELCRVYGTLRFLNGDPIAGAYVYAFLESALDTLTYSGAEYLGDIPPARTDANGYWYMDLTPNTLLDTNSKYIIRYVKQGVKGLPRERKIVVPDQGTADINDL